MQGAGRDAAGLLRAVVLHRVLHALETDGWAQLRARLRGDVAVLGQEQDLGALTGVHGRLVRGSGLGVGLRRLLRCHVLVLMLLYLLHDGCVLRAPVLHGPMLAVARSAV